MVCCTYLRVSGLTFKRTLYSCVAKVFVKGFPRIQRVKGYLVVFYIILQILTVLSLSIQRNPWSEAVSELGLLLLPMPTKIRDARM